MTRRERIAVTRWSGIIALGIALGACQPKAPPPVGPPVVAPDRPMAPALAPADYFALAASIDLFAVRSAELARTRTASPAVRDFANLVGGAHNGTAAQLSIAGRRLNLLPPASLLARHQAMLDALAASADFDTDFRRQMVDLHRAAVDLHANFARAGDSPTLRPVAGSAARIERVHLESALAL